MTTIFNYIKISRVIVFLINIESETKKLDDDKKT